MMSFKKYMKSEEDENILDSLKKIPKSHSDLVDGYRFTLKGGNTLPGDNKHIGYKDENPKEICVAAPWNYGREFTLLHEIAHKVWEERVPAELKNKWKKIVSRTKGRPNQTAEELFCMAYAQHYAGNKMVKYDYPEWDKFIKDLPK